MVLKSNNHQVMTDKDMKNNIKTGNDENAIQLYKKIELLIENKIEDPGRLNHILITLKQGKPLYNSDKNFLNKCLSIVLEVTNEKNTTSKILPVYQKNFKKEENSTTKNQCRLIYSEDQQEGKLFKEHSTRKFADNDNSMIIESIETLSNKIEDLRDEFEHGLSISESRDRTLTSHIHSLNARFEDNKITFENNSISIKEDLKAVKSELAALKSSITSNEIQSKNNIHFNQSIKQDSAKPQISNDENIENHTEILKQKINSLQSHLNSLNPEIDNIFSNYNSKSVQLQSAKKQIETIKMEYAQKETSARKEIEKLNAEIASLKSTEILKTIEVKQNVSKEHTLELEKAKTQLETLRKEYEDKLAQKREVEEYVENQIPALSSQIANLNEEYRKTSLELEKAKTELKKSK
ncbi:hypothetical protein YTPLAS73_00770 [Nitrosarchaeum sp.]|nr:hypothetical protein YTPLAS73_00770 [Nitrosarchaeum sp.]